jgi:hypothetical protein
MRVLPNVGRLVYGMDYSLIVLVGLVVATLVVPTMLQIRAWPGRPGSQYQSVLSMAALGILFTVAGAVGWDLSQSHGWFQGTTWVESPVWWQIGVGIASLALSVFFARRVSPRPARR